MDIKYKGIFTQPPLISEIIIDSGTGNDNKSGLTHSDSPISESLAQPKLWRTSYRPDECSFDNLPTLIKTA